MIPIFSQVSYLDIFRKSEESIVLSAPGIVQGDLFINNSRKMHESILLMVEIWLSRNCPSSTKFAAKVHMFINKLWFPLTTISCHVSIMQQMYTGPGAFVLLPVFFFPRFFSKTKNAVVWFTASQHHLREDLLLSSNCWPTSDVAAKIFTQRRFPCAPRDPATDASYKWIYIYINNS